MSERNGHGVHRGRAFWISVRISCGNADKMVELTNACNISRCRYHDTCLVKFYFVVRHGCLVNDQAGEAEGQQFHLIPGVTLTANTTTVERHLGDSF